MNERIHIIVYIMLRMLRTNRAYATQVMKLAGNMNGIFVGDAGYISKKLEYNMYKENQRFFFSRPKKNMKKIATPLQRLIYDTRMRIELNFRSLKIFHGLVTSLPRSIDGYISNYLYSMVAYMLA